MSYADGVYLNRGSTPVPPEERFWFRVNKTETCWLWTGAVQADGYGRLAGEPGKVVAAHRFAYELLIGPIPDGLFIDHLCRVHNCVNPDHLEAVTNQENLVRGIKARHAHRGNHCKNGHEMTAENTYVRPGRSTWIDCKTCRYERTMAARRRKQAEV